MKDNKVVSLCNEIIGIFNKHGKEVTELHVEEKFSKFSYPKLMPLMRFVTNFYKVDNIGNMFIMKTDSPFMQLLTVSITPYDNVPLPYTLIDIMISKRKIVFFIEYYSCTDVKLNNKLLLHNRHYADKNFTDYKEKSAWYNRDGVRESFSIIKESSKFSEVEKMILMSIRNIIGTSHLNDGYNIEHTKLSILRDRMLKEGNPATGTLKRIFSNSEIEQLY